MSIDLEIRLYEKEDRLGVADCEEQTDDGNYFNDDDDELIIDTRLDITASLLEDWSDEQKNHLCERKLQKYEGVVTTVHLSGLQLQSVLGREQIKKLVESIGKLKSVTELFVFQGGSSMLNEDLVAANLPPNLQVLMLWQFRKLPNSLAGAMRQHPTLSRVTLNLPCPREKKQLKWGCLDVFAMAFASMEHLKVLQIRCVPQDDIIYTQQDSLMTPEAFALLLNSNSIEHLYLENCGLIDDHMDLAAEELSTNKNRTLTKLDVKHNIFSDDCLYTMGRLLPVLPPQLTAIDVSGADITVGAGQALAKGMAKNNTLLSLELEGTLLRFHDEFDIPAGHSETEWMQNIQHQLRLNRAYAAAGEAAANDPTIIPSYNHCKHSIRKDPATFVAAVSAVSDNASCLYHFLRSFPAHCNRLTAPTPFVEQE